jgi:DNA-binding Xre family transcriptional regulator
MERAIQSSLIEQAISKAKSESNLATFMGISRTKVNDLKHNRVPSKLGDLKKLCKFLNSNLQNLEIQGFATRKGKKLNIGWNMQVEHKLAWLLGIRMGDKSEDNYSIGVISTDTEIINKFLRYTCEVFKIPHNNLHCYVKVPKIEKQIEYYQQDFADVIHLNPENIHIQPFHSKQVSKKIQFVIRFYHSVASSLFRKIDLTTNDILNKSSNKAKYAFIQGIIDSDGRVRKWGSVEIAMSKKNLKRMKIINSIIQSTTLDVSKLHYRKRNIVSLTIYATKKNKKLLFKKIGSTIPRKMMLIKNAYL